MRDIRISIAVIVTLLISLGITMIYSSSGIYALQELGDKTYFLSRHLLFLLIGLMAVLCVMAFDYRDLRAAAKPLLLIVIALLVLVLIPGIGRKISGARRWFSIGPFHFQPSEFAKLAVLVYVADFLARKQNKIKNFLEGFLPLIIILCLLCLLIVKQPDLGNSLLIAVIILIMMFTAGARILHIGILALLTMPVLFFLVVSVPYRLKRIIAFLNPWEDAAGIGFQLSQSQIALGSGGVFGVGLGKSVQKLFYLPAAHTDFILSIIGEELGLLGTLAVVVLFAALIWQGARIAKRTVDPFGYYLAFGIVVMIGLQAVVNIGVSIGAFPTKGLPLPFISYGGSSLIFNMIAVALLLNISRIQDL
ncbi:MAG: putative lipid II flippase FtsW [Candidatus Omnitrophica bacterium]|nr:putative lipid II flippase FtsW [Candidatus Omnitrophota bacterium]